MNIEAEKHNRIRVYILKILSPQHPHPVDAVLLRRCLADFGYPISDHALESYLAYLEERGCLKITKKEQFNITMAAITAKGLDILDKRIFEDGIKVD